MASSSQGPDILNFDEGRKLPDMLNVITILTFVGCGIGLIVSLYGFFHAQKAYDDILKLQDKLDSVPDFFKPMVGPKMVVVARNSLENRVPILLLSLVGYVLCLYGAIKMRAWKKDGFPFYVLGEILPIVSGFIFVGSDAFSGVGLFGSLVIPGAFILMYASQRKNLS